MKKMGFFCFRAVWGAFAERAFFWTGWEASRGCLPGGHGLLIAPMGSIIFLFLILMLASQEPDQEVATPPPFSQFLSLWFEMCLATPPPSYSLIYLLLRGKANITNLYTKVAERSMLSRSLSSYKNTKDVALLAFLEEPSPEDPEWITESLAGK